MNAMVVFRANGAGQFVANRAQRQAVAEEITANLRAKLEGAATQKAAKSAQAANQPAAKSGATSQQTTQTIENELDRDAFLQLLVTQMQNQDPLDPIDNSEMIAQLAQLSSLEQMENLNSSFEALGERMEFLVGNTDQLNFISAQSLLGKYVQGLNIDGELTEGQVDSVTLDGSIIVLSVDGEYVPMTTVLAISEGAPQEASTSGGSGGA